MRTTILRLDRHARRRKQLIRASPNSSARRQRIGPILLPATREYRCAQVLLPQRGLIERDRTRNRAAAAFENGTQRFSICGGASSSRSSAPRRSIRRLPTSEKESTRPSGRAAYARRDG